MKKMNESTKVTLTLGQLKKLVKESIEDQGIFHWSISEMRPGPDGDLEDYDCVADSAENFTIEGFSTPEEAFENGLQQLKTYTDGDYSLVVYTITSKRAVDIVDGYSAEIRDGEVYDYSTPTNESMSDEIEDGVESDVDTAVKDLFDMYRACKMEPKVCNAIKADGEKTSIFMDRGNSVGGIARALRDGRLLKVIDFN